MEGGPYHHVGYNFSGASVTITFLLDARLSDVSNFTIYVDGVAYPAAQTDMGNNRVRGQVTRPVPDNPHEFQTYAIAVTRYGGSGTAAVNDSRNPPYGTPNYNGPLGSGHETCFILANIELKGLKWEGKACEQVYERSRVDRKYPNSPPPAFPNFEEPYHLGYITENSVRREYRHPAVYLKGTAPSLKFTVKPLTGPVPVRVHVTDFNLSVPTPGYPFNTKSAPLVGNETTIACLLLKNEVNLLNAGLKFSFECQFQDGYWCGLYAGILHDIGGLRLYSVYAQPLLRSGSNRIPTNVPWDELLQQTCTWAAGQSTYLDVAEKLTTGLNSSGWFYADNGTGFIDYVSPMEFALGLCVDAGSNQPGNCFVVSDYLCICANMQGLEFQVSAHQSAPGPMFRSNPLCQIGTNPATGGYSHVDWNIHQVARSYSGTVYDAFCAQQKDLAGADYRKTPVNWPWPGYWQTPAPIGTTGLVFANINEDGSLQQQSAPIKPYHPLFAGFPNEPYTPIAF